MSEIAKCVLEKYEKLPKKGKPVIKNPKMVEWTVLAGIVKEENNRDQTKYECVALGTGTKCLGEKELSKYGDLLFDSHAEVISKRAFNLYLVNQLELFLSQEDQNDSIFMNIKDNQTNMDDSPDKKRGEGNGCSRLKTRDIKFHLYVSQCPCGDASTNQLLDQLNNVNCSTFLDVSGDKPASSSLKRGCEQEEKNTDKRPPKKSRDICSSPNDSVDENKYVYNNQILVRGRSNFNILSTLRTKPGRADADSTLSMSCSDKIAMWNVTGIQNSILSSIIEPIYFSSIVIGDSTSYLKDSYRAFNQRIKNLDKGLVELPFKINEVKVCSADLEFSHSQGSIKTKHPEAKLIAADGSINWYRFEKTQNTQSGNGSGDGYSKNFVQNGILEVTVKGRLQGSPGISAAKKKQSQPSSDDCITLEKHRSKLCKLELCKRIVYLMSKYETLRAISAKNTNANTHPDTSLGEGHSISFKQTYKQLKSKSTQYQNAKRSLKESVFKSWVSKPGDLDDFIIE